MRARLAPLGWVKGAALRTRCLIAALFAGKIWASEREPLELFQRACLEIIPKFDGTSETFVSAGLASASAEGSARTFGSPPGVTAHLLGADPTRSALGACHVFPGRHTAVDRTDAMVLVKTAVAKTSVVPVDASCGSRGFRERCDWWVPGGVFCILIRLDLFRDRVASLFVAVMNRECDGVPQ